MTKPRPTPERVRELLRYDPITGKVYWRIRVANRVQAGDEAGFLSCGRHVIGFKGVRIVRSIVAWAIVKGEWPTLEVDHKNRNGLDDSWENLRLATRSQNLANRGMLRSNTSGAQGVKFIERYNKWQATIQKDGKGMYLGRHPSKEEAIAVYRAKAKELFGEFAPT